MTTRMKKYLALTALLLLTMTIRAVDYNSTISSSTTSFSTSSSFMYSGSSLSSGTTIGGGTTTTSTSLSDLKDYYTLSMSPYRTVGEYQGNMMKLYDDDDDEKPEGWDDPYMSPISDVPFVLMALLAIGFVAVRRRQA